MPDIARLISCLEQTPQILQNLLDQIPEELIRVRRIKNKWSIHEHACHIATGDKIGFLDRFTQFLNEETPKITPLSGESFPEDYLQKINLNEAMKEFIESRQKLINLVSSADNKIWTKIAKHPEYEEFTPYIMLRHRLLHDFLHMYRIEELWLTKDEYLR